MSLPLAAKLDFILKALSMSRSRMAADLGVDKSAVGRWISGAAEPSAHSMSQITALVAARIPGFTALDWDRDLEGLAEALGVAPPGQRRGAGATATLANPLLEESLATTRVRGSAYEGFYRTTRPYFQAPTRFIHDQVMVRADPGGFLKLSMITAGVPVEGQVMLLHDKLFFVGAEMTSRSFTFAILNGVSTVQAGVIDGIVLVCALDAGRTPNATAAIFERIGDLSGDAAADDARFAELAKAPHLATAASAPEHIRRHLVRDLGPREFELGGDFLLSMPVARSMARGLALPPEAVVG
ncbi:MAG: helix-turn-helix domain-containing protein [Phenylobacterium sp.]